MFGLRQWFIKENGARRLAALPMVLLALLALAACGGRAVITLPPEQVPAAAPMPAADFADPVFSVFSGEASLTGTNAAGETGSIDPSGANQGYVMAACTTPREARLLIEKDGVQSGGLLTGDGLPRAFSLTLGSGSYRLAIMLAMGENRYEPLVELTIEVTLADSRAPYTVPNHMVWYEAGSPVTELAAALAAGCATETELALAAFSWITKNITYDEHLLTTAVNGGAGYRPDLVRVITEGTGICGDYAALFAAILRLNGVPCQMVHGSVDALDGSTVYHAWNLAWLPSQGGGYHWVHFDPTFNHSESAVMRAALGLPRLSGIRYGEVVARY